MVVTGPLTLPHNKTGRPRVQHGGGVRSGFPDHPEHRIAVGFAADKRVACLCAEMRHVDNGGGIIRQNPQFGARR